MNELAIIDATAAIARAKSYSDIVKVMRTDVLREGIDYGLIPGVAKPTLLKPGAERLCNAFGLCPEFITITRTEVWDDDNPLFHYEFQCRLIDIATGKMMATGSGSCNSKESKYRWRWVSEAELPTYLDKTQLEYRDTTISEFQFAVDKRETGGQYGKPAEYWQRFATAIQTGSAIAGKRKTSKGAEYATWEIPGMAYRIPNDDVFSQVNTILKMAQKRALVAAVLIGTNASDYFTQDVEDMRDFGTIDAEVIVETSQPVTPAPSTNERADSGRPATGTRRNVRLPGGEVRGDKNGKPYLFFHTDTGETIALFSRAAFRDKGYCAENDWKTVGERFIFDPPITVTLIMQDNGYWDIDPATIPPFDPAWADLKPAQAELPGTPPPNPLEQYGVEDIPM